MSLRKWRWVVSLPRNGRVDDVLWQHSVSERRPGTNSCLHLSLNFWKTEPPKWCSVVSTLISPQLYFTYSCVYGRMLYNILYLLGHVPKFQIPSAHSLPHFSIFRKTRSSSVSPNTEQTFNSSIVLPTKSWTVLRSLLNRRATYLCVPHRQRTIRRLWVRIILILGQWSETIAQNKDATLSFSSSFCHQCPLI